MGATAAELARRVVGELRGDGNFVVNNAAPLQKAGPSDITFAADEKQLKRLRAGSAGVVIVSPGVAAAIAADPIERTVIIVADPFAAFLNVLPLFRPQRAQKPVGISPRAFICETAEIGPGCNIHPGAYVGEGARLGANCELFSGAVVGDDCVLGEECVLHPHAVLYPNCTLGDRVVLHAGAVIGADGFGYRYRDGRYQKIPQLGSVTLGDDVEIGACSTIDRGMIGPTVIGEGTKLDNLVMIGHNCEIGKHCVMAAQAGFAGSVTTEDNIRFGGQMGVSDHVHIGGNSSFGARSGVHKDMAPGGMYLGTPVTEEYEQIRMVMAVQKLPELRKQLRQMESRIEELSKQVRALHAGDLEPLGS